MNDSPETISGDQLVRALRRRWWVVAQVALAGAAVGALLALTTPQRYESTATVLIESALRGDSGGEGSGRLSAEAAARLVRTRGVAERVSRRLGDARAPGELLADVSANPNGGGAFVDVTARGDGPAGAARLANAFAEEFIAARAESVTARARRAIEAAERELSRLPAGSGERSRLASELADLRATAALGGIEAELVDPAVAAAGLRDDALVTWTAIGAGLGLLLGLGLAFALEALDPRVRTLAELPRLVGAPQLAAVPELRRRRRKGPPVLAARREPFEHLRGALLVGDGRRRLRRIVVTSPDDRHDGKTIVAASLALSLARLGLRVCAVDADLRRPGLASHFGLDDAARGLADALQGAPLESTIQRFAVPAEAGRNGSRPGRPAELSVIAAGGTTPDAAELLAGERMEQVLDELGRAHDVVILDSAPVLTVSDGVPLLERASGTILVVRHSRTSRRAVARGARVVADANGSLLGLVATGVPKRELTADGYGPWPVPGPATHEF